MNPLPRDAYQTLRRPRPRPDHIASFGTDAERWGARLSGIPRTVLADHSLSAEALEEATQRRVSEFLLTGPMVDEARSVIARRLAPQIIASTSDRGKRRAMFHALANESLVIDGVTQQAMRALDPNVVQTLRELYLVGTSAIVRSRRQAAYLGGLFGRHRPGYIVRPGFDAEVPQPSTRAQDPVAILIWAPHSDISELSIYLFALEGLNAPIVIVGSGDASAFPDIRVTAVASAQNELSQAALVVDTTLSDPSSAIALAAWDIPLVAASSSGADEFIEGVRLYDPWNWRSILAAVSAGRGDASPAIAVRRAFGRVGAVSAAVEDSGAPLVTIIVPTFDRADVLPLALDSLQAQSYQNLEILVINDGGPSVDHIVARYSRTRSINSDVNLGVYKAWNYGISMARGKYIGFLGDDDIYYFDHIERLVAALQQSRAKVAHANVLTRFLQANSLGILQTIGNQVMYWKHLDKTEALWAGQQAMGGLLVDRSAFEEVGMLEETNVAADYEITVRLSRCFDFVHVDQVTYEWRYRTDGSTFSHRIGIAAIERGLAEIFERYPADGDALVEKGRVETLAFYRAHFESQFYEPALRLPVEGLS
jgi:glycosyltransferase involved in cell wall biosynthesis